MNVGIVGLGLMGGSIALDLRDLPWINHIIGAESNKRHAQEAIRCGLVDRIVLLEQIICEVDLIVLALPTDVILELLPFILDQIESHVIVTDVGSTKSLILASVAHHPNRKQFVAAHPMAGTEYSGPLAAQKDLFANQSLIICNAHQSSQTALEVVEKMYLALGAKITHMDGDKHDLCAAYVSHISHITSFALSLTVLEKEKSESNILNMAAGGFDSTVRLAKSSPDMWAPIFLQNKDNILEVARTYIDKMKAFVALIEKNDEQSLKENISKANEIKKILEA